MMNGKRVAGCLGTVVLLTAAGLFAPGTAAHAATTWVEGWAAAPHSSAAETTVPTFTNQTIRMIVRLRAGGDRVRIRLSNTFGDRAVRFGRASVAIRTSGAAVTSLRFVNFAGQPGATVNAGAEVSSDPVALTVRTGQDLAVSVYLPAATGPATWHRSALQTSYLTGSGDHSGEAGAGAFTTTTGHWFFLDAVSVSSPTAPGTIVALGDSITDGSGSTGNTNRRWPDRLADRLAAAPGPDESVVNEGISGNRVLADSDRSGQSALHRLTRDVLVRRGLRHVVLLEGINDLKSATAPSTAEQIIAGYRQIIDAVHGRGAKIYGATITPFEGSSRYSTEFERQRQAVNDWIRTGGAFDGVVDFDRATRDPAHPLRLLPGFDSGDHLHPNDAGYQAMAASIDLNLFT